MKFTMYYDQADRLMKFAKNYLGDDRFPIIQCSLADGELTAVMLDGYKLVKAVFHVDSTDSGEFFMAPVKGFKKSDPFVTVEPGAKETVYTTATGSITAKMPEHGEPLNWKCCVADEAIETVCMNPELLIKALEPYAKAKTPVKIDFLGKLKGVTIASADAKSFVLPMRPADNANYMEF